MQNFKFHVNNDNVITVFAPRAKDCNSIAAVLDESVDLHSVGVPEYSSREELHTVDLVARDADNATRAASILSNIHRVVFAVAETY